MSEQTRGPEAYLSSKSDLGEIYGPPLDVAVNAKLKRLDAHYRKFIARSPFICIATASAAGIPSVSPKGDAPGFVQIADDTTLVIPDRPGNNQLAGFHNLLENAAISIIFFIPGIEETLRVVGRARLVRDLATLEANRVNGKLPPSAIVVTIESVFIHCGKSIRRSKIWNPAGFAQKGEVPTLGEMLISHGGSAANAPVAAVNDMIEESYRKHLY